jgi:vitamin B12 transporter
MMYRIYVLFMFLFVTGKVCAQSLPDTTLLPEVPVQSGRYKIFSIGVKTTTIDSIALKENFSGTLTELLSTRSPVFIKDYGAGTLATISFRGTSASQTQVNWNGFPINSMTAGETDFSLIPVSLADKVTLVHGGSSSLYGSGAIGGSVQIDNMPSWQKGISVLLSDEYGSFSTNRTRLKVIAGNRIFQSASTVYFSASKNNYPFVNTTLIDGPKVRQTNAEAHQHGFIQSISVKLGKTSILSGSIWYQNNEKNIPPQMFASSGKASQKDSCLRSFAGWTKNIKSGSFALRSAWFSEYLAYSDPVSKIDSRNKVNRSMSEAELRRSFFNEKILINSGISFTYAKATVVEYGGSKEQFRTGIFAGIKYILSEKWKTNFTVRKDFVSGYKTPIAPAIGLEGKIAKGFFLKSSVTRNFNIPTLNQRFWIPGGNPDLKPEKGWSSDVGVKHILSISDKNLWTTELTAYSSVINNWLQWMPPTNGGLVWTPRNAKKVWARGLEAKINYVYAYKKWKSELTFNYAHSVSTNRAIYAEDSSVLLGKQLLYVPIDNFNLTWHVEYAKFFITYNHNFTGYRFTDSENDHFLPGYIVSNLYLGKKLQSKLFSTYLQLKISNIWNTSYQVVSWWAMPGRAFYLNVQFEFNNRK